jgi:hypothetical protein
VVELGLLDRAVPDLGDGTGRHVAAATGGEQGGAAEHGDCEKRLERHREVSSCLL